MQSVLSAAAFYFDRKPLCLFWRKGFLLVKLFTYCAGQIASLCS